MSTDRLSNNVKSMIEFCLFSCNLPTFSFSFIGNLLIKCSLYKRQPTEKGKWSFFGPHVKVINDMWTQNAIYLITSPGVKYKITLKIFQSTLKNIFPGGYAKHENNLYGDLLISMAFRI